MNARKGVRYETRDPYARDSFLSPGGKNDLENFRLRLSLLRFLRVFRAPLRGKRIASEFGHHTVILVESHYSTFVTRRVPKMK